MRSFVCFYLLVHLLLRIRSVRAPPLPLIVTMGIPAYSIPKIIMTFYFLQARISWIFILYTGFELLKASGCVLWATSEAVSLSDGTWTRRKVSISLTTCLSCHSGCETFTDSLRGGGRQTEAWQRRKHAKSPNATQGDWWDRWTALTTQFI